MSLSPEAVLDTLLGVLEDLYRDTNGFADEPGDSQLWYNRGYANGMIQALTDKGHADAVQTRVQADPDNVIQGHEIMAWGQAYKHGFETGIKDVSDVL